MEALIKTWLDECERAFTRMLPKVAYTHGQVLQNESAAIRMGAVDIAHANQLSCVRTQATTREVEELNQMVRMLCDQLARQSAG
jgi:hypothetical protein